MIFSPCFSSPHRFRWNKVGTRVLHFHLWLGLLPLAQLGMSFKGPDYSGRSKIMSCLERRRGGRIHGWSLELRICSLEVTENVHLGLRHKPRPAVRERRHTASSRAYVHAPFVWRTNKISYSSYDARYDTSRRQIPGENCGSPSYPHYGGIAFRLFMHCEPGQLHKYTIGAVTGDRNAIKCGTSISSVHCCLPRHLYITEGPFPIGSY